MLMCVTGEFVCEFVFPCGVEGVCGAVMEDEEGERDGRLMGLLGGEDVVWEGEVGFGVGVGCCSD